METIASKLFSSEVPSETGELLFQSTWKDVQSSSEAKVLIYQRCICQQPDLYMLYTFDIKFSVTPKHITFSVEEDSYEYELLEKDNLIWRGILKNYLNQKGFHEQFKPIKKIGKGNFASVYLVEKLDDKAKYAVKAFSKEAAYSEENGKQCLIKEIQVMRQLNNPHNMKLHEVFESDNSLYVVFQLLEGGQLFEKIKVHFNLIILVEGEVQAIDGERHDQRDP